MRRLGPAIILVLALFLVLPACGNDAQTDSLEVVVSILPQAWLVQRIGGEDIVVRTLVGPGESPSTHQPTDAQVSAVMRAKAWFSVGVPFENGPWREALEQVGGLRVVDTRTGIRLRAIEEHGPGAHGGDHEHVGGVCSHDGLDPHVWLSPGGLEAMAENIANALVEIDPSGAETYRQNLASLRTELHALDAELKETLAPCAGRTVYVFHPAWGYFCDAYGLTQVAIELEGKEPSESELTSLILRARKDRAKVVFVQAQIHGRAAQAMARAIGAEVRTLDPLAENVVENLRAVAAAIVDAMS